MTFLTQHPVHFGAIVRHTRTGLHYLCVGWNDKNKLAAVCERPGDPKPVLFHRDNLSVVRPSRSWKERARGRSENR